MPVLVCWVAEGLANSQLAHYKVILNLRLDVHVWVEAYIEDHAFILQVEPLPTDFLKGVVFGELFSFDEGLEDYATFGVAAE